MPLKAPFQNLMSLVLGGKFLKSMDSVLLTIV